MYKRGDVPCQFPPLCNLMRTRPPPNECGNGFCRYVAENYFTMNCALLNFGTSIFTLET